MIKTWINKIFGLEQKGMGESILAASAGFTGLSPRPTVHNMAEYLGRYADQAWVYACIRVIATKGAGVPLNVCREIGDGEVETLPDHPLKKLLDSANKWMSGYDLLEATHGFIELSGNAYWLLDAYVDGKPTEIYPLDPSRVEVVSDRQKYVTGYTYSLGQGDKKKFDISEVVHFKTWNPLDPFYGLAPISSARDSADALMSADRMNKKLFENSAEPGGVLSSASPIRDEATRNRIMKSWEKMHRGPNNAHRIALLDGGLEWKSKTQTNRDMEFVELKRMTREDILAAFGIPPIMVGVFDEANYSNAREQRRIFWVDSMIPRLRKIESVLNEKLVKMFDPSVYVAFDLQGIEELSEDKKLTADTDAVLISCGALTINEARARRDLDPVAWGDTWNAPLGLSPIEGHDEPPEPVDGSPLPSAPAPVEDEPAEDEEPVEQDDEAEDDGDKAVDPIQHLADGARIAKERRWYRFKGFTEAQERKWMPTLRRLFSEQEKEVIRNVRDAGEQLFRQIRLDGMKSFHQKMGILLFDRKKSRSEFRKEGKRLIELTLAAKAKEEIEDYMLGISFNLYNPEVVAWIGKKSFQFSEKINETTEEALKTALQEAIKAGESISKIEDRIAEVFDIARGSRTKLIARTEVVSASNKGAVEAYKQAGVDKIAWSSSMDDDVRTSHRIDSEDPVKIGFKFSNGLKFPGDPEGPLDEICNCRCTVTPVRER